MMKTLELDTIPEDAAQKAIKKAPDNLRWLVEMLQEPKSVRRLHRLTNLPKKRLRAALVHLKMLGLIDEHRLPGGGSVWGIRVGGA